MDESFLPDAKMLANKLFENAPGAVNVKDLKVDMVYIYGRVVPVSGTVLPLPSSCRKNNEKIP